MKFQDWPRNLRDAPSTSVYRKSPALIHDWFHQSGATFRLPMVLSPWGKLISLAGQSTTPPQIKSRCFNYWICLSKFKSGWWNLTCSDMQALFLNLQGTQTCFSAKMPIADVAVMLQVTQIVFRCHWIEYHVDFCCSYPVHHPLTLVSRKTCWIINFSKRKLVGYHASGPSISASLSDSGTAVLLTFSAGLQCKKTPRFTERMTPQRHNKPFEYVVVSGAVQKR